jgi:hypothetical protein
VDEHAEAGLLPPLHAGSPLRGGLGSGQGHELCSKNRDDEDKTLVSFHVRSPGYVL